MNINKGIQYCIILHLYLSVGDEVSHSADHKADEVEEDEDHHGELPASSLTLNKTEKILIVKYDNIRFFLLSLKQHCYRKCGETIFFASLFILVV